MKKVLVCGATGFIGRNVAEFLAAQEDYDVYGTYLDSAPFDHPRIQMRRVDLRDKGQVDGVVRGMDIIIQAAATTSGAKEIIGKPYYHVTDNAVMNSLIFRSAFEQGVGQVVFFSCSVMYQSSDRPVKETDFDANQPIFPSYFGVGWTKVYVEKMCEFYARIGKAKYTVIRHSNIYGPHDKFDLEKSHVFGATMTKVMTAPDGGEILVWGTGEEERDLLYISDLVDFVHIVLRRQESKFELVNAGCGQAVTIKDLVNKIIARSGKSIRIQHDISKPTIKTKLCLDITKARQIFGWAPRVTIDQGIDRTMQWYKANIQTDRFLV